jgi:methionyl-tRNA formyltransferase
MKILFWGTPEFAVPCLRALDEEGFDIVGVVSQPDRPAGRGQRLRMSAVKQVALEQGFAVLTPDRPRGDDFMAAVRELAPELSVVVAYGHILKPEVLALPPRGSINVHASLLPELRGAAPVTWAIARGHAQTGVTIMRMSAGMDAGPIIHQVAGPILSDESASELAIRLSEMGAQALVEALALMSDGSVEERQQDEDAVTFAPKVDRATARINWDLPAIEVARFIRAMDSIPGAWSESGGAQVKFFRPSTVRQHDVSPPEVPGPTGNGGAPMADVPLPGTVVGTDPDRGVLVATADGGVLVTEVQPAGKRRMGARDWINGRGVGVGSRFE